MGTVTISKVAQLNSHLIQLSTIISTYTTKETWMITEDQFELIDAALDVYLMKQNEGRGNPLLNRQAGRLLRDLKTMMENQEKN